ncbi:MAG: TIGR02253 family HAD-type hydrolase [archaeon]
MIRAVIFDLDNTLMDFMRLKRMSCEEAMDAMIDAGLDIPKEKAMKKLFSLYDTYGIEYKEIFQKFLKETIGKIDFKILASGIVAYRRVKNGFLAPYPGVRRTLLSLRQMGVKLAILSDAPRMRAWTRLAAMGLTDYFDVVVTFDDTKVTKPHPRPFEKVLKLLNISRGEAVMVGDWPERDLKGAREMGITTCYAKYGSVKTYAKVNTDHVLTRVTDLIKVVEKENR